MTGFSVPLFIVARAVAGDRVRRHAGKPEMFSRPLLPGVAGHAVPRIRSAGRQEDSR